MPRDACQCQCQWVLSHRSPAAAPLLLLLLSRSAEAEHNGTTDRPARCCRSCRCHGQPTPRAVFDSGTTGADGSSVRPPSTTSNCLAGRSASAVPGPLRLASLRRASPGLAHRSSLHPSPVRTSSQPLRDRTHWPGTVHHEVMICTPSSLRPRLTIISDITRLLSARGSYQDHRWVAAYGSRTWLRSRSRCHCGTLNSDAATATMSCFGTRLGRKRDSNAVQRTLHAFVPVNARILVDLASQNSSGPVY